MNIIWKLTPRAVITFSLDRTTATITIDESTSFCNLSELCQEFFESVIDGCSAEKMSTFRKDSECNQIFEFLFDEHLIFEVEENNYCGTQWEKNVDFISAFKDNPSTAQKNLSEYSICILGLGGVGAILMANLISMGFSKFVLIDGDQVEITNLNRQYIYSLSDVGKRKVEVAKTWALERNNNLIISTVDIFIETQSDLSKIFGVNDTIDFFACCADQPVFEIRRLVSSYCFENNVAAGFASVGIDNGYVGPFLRSDNSREHFEKFSNLRMTSQDTTTKIISGSNSATNSIVASHFSLEIFKQLLGIDEAQTHIINFFE